MKDILTAAHRPVLEEFASSNVLLAFDFDGTLAPIVADPARAQPRGATRELLGALCRLYRVAVISGRATADIRRRVSGLPFSAVVGDHGIERWNTAQPQLRKIERWRSLLERAARAHRGVIVEDKIFSLAVHYRRSREKKRALATILRVGGGLAGARVIRGKQVVNVYPDDAPHKGTALEQARARFGCDTAIYVGDDETDEDVFALDQPGRLLTIRVGASRASAAVYFVRGQRAVDGLLRVLVSARKRWDEERRAAG